MKKMIPVYLLQILMLAAFLFVSRQVLNEMRSMKAEIQAELASTKVRPGGPQLPQLPQGALGAPAMRVVIVGSR
jgi:hypothetical protein